MRRSGARVAFLAGDTGVGLLDGGQARFIEPKGISYLHDVAVGTAGPPVFAGIPPEGGRGGQRLIARLAPDFRGWERLATQGGEIVPGSLAVGDDGRVTWRTKAGLTQDTPLDGETVDRLRRRDYVAGQRSACACSRRCRPASTTPGCSPASRTRRRRCCC